MMSMIDKVKFAAAYIGGLAITMAVVSLIVWPTGAGRFVQFLLAVTVLSGIGLLEALRWEADAIRSTLILDRIDALARQQSDQTVATVADGLNAALNGHSPVRMLRPQQ